MVDDQTSNKTIVFVSAFRGDLPLCGGTAAHWGAPLQAVLRNEARAAQGHLFSGGCGE